MKLFGNLRELAKLYFRVGGKEVEISPAAQSGSAPVLTIPDVGDEADTFVMEDTAATLINKSIDGDDNTLTDLNPTSVLKTDIANAHDVVAYDASGAPEISKITDANVDASAGIDASKVSSGSVSNSEFDKLNTAGNDAAGELVTTNSGQTLSFKDIEDANSKFVNDNDSSKELQFELGGSTSSTTTTLSTSSTVNRNLTLPDTDGTLATLADVTANDEFVELTDTPGAYAGAGKIVQTNGSDDGLEFGGVVAGSSSGDIVDVDTAAQPVSGKIFRDARWLDELASITSGVLALPTETVSRVDSIAALDEIASAADGRLIAIWNNHASDDLLIGNDATVTTGKKIFTGSGLDLRLKAGATVLFRFDGNNDAWYAVGGAGGGGGLTLSRITADPAAAVQGFHYLTDSSGGAFSVTLPAGADQAVIRLSDITDSWGANPVTLVPDGAETIDGQASCILDVSGLWVQLMWDGTEWVTDDPIDPALISGGGMETADDSSGSLTVAAGRTRTHQYLRIRPADTYTIAGRLVAGQSLTVDGSLVISGTGSVIVHDLI